jgi:DNA-binding MarR family transcriptional regulator
MAGRVAATEIRQEPISPETLETCRLLVEFLHAAYAARGDPMAGDPRAADTVGGEASGIRPSQTVMSSHAARAAVYIHQHGERTVGQLAVGLGISYGWASRVVEELEAGGLVIRDRDRRDRRVVNVRLEPAAIEAVEREYRWHPRDVRYALEPLSEMERDAVRSFLRRVTGRLREDLEETAEAGR